MELTQVPLHGGQAFFELPHFLRHSGGMLLAQCVHLLAAVPTSRDGCVPQSDQELGQVLGEIVRGESEMWRRDAEALQ